MEILVCVSVCVCVCLSLCHRNVDLIMGLIQRATLIFFPFFLQGH